jgi:hypothetical protein
VKNFGQAVDTLIAKTLGVLCTIAKTPEEEHRVLVEMLRFEARVFSTLDPLAPPH